ncbi:MAG: Wzz/FepE/Etk N-terminal domain-containing protein [Balneolaceae bacterium]
MYEIKDFAQDLKSAAKRRRVILILSPILFAAAALLAVYFIDPKYQSTTTILVQEDETLNPLVMYEIAVDIASEDRIESLNEIIYSRSTMEILIDSLNLDSDVESEADKQDLIAKTQKNIGTKLEASDAFEISFFDTDPVRARNGAEFLTNHFINTKLRMESRRHEETVDFFSNKLAELETIVESQRDQAVISTSDRMGNLPSDADALQERLQIINGQLDTIEWQLLQEEEKLATVESYQDEANVNEGINHLYKLPLMDMQYGEELTLLLNEYNDVSQQFTESYPRLRTLAEQIKQVADRIPPVLTSNVQRLTVQKQDLNNQKERVVGDMQQYYVATQRASSQQSDFSIYEGLQAEMKVKLEQAKMTRDIGMRAADQFIVLDAAIVPEKPISPNKPLILGIGLLLGVIIGIVASAVAEAMDTTIRNEEDMPFEKPIIAYITSG